MVATSKKPRRPMRGIYQESAGGCQGVFELALEDQVEEGYRVGQVTKEIPYTTLRGFRHDVIVALCDRPEYGLVEPPC